MTLQMKSGTYSTLRRVIVVFLGPTFLFTTFPMTLRTSTSTVPMPCTAYVVLLCVLVIWEVRGLNVVNQSRWVATWVLESKDHTQSMLYAAPEGGIVCQRCVCVLASGKRSKKMSSIRLHLEFLI